MARRSINAGSATAPGADRDLRQARRGERLVCGIEPQAEGAYRLTWVTLRGDKAVKVESGGVISDDESAKRGWVRGGARRRTESVLVLPRLEAIVRWTRVPSTEPRQVAQMVSFEVAAHAPWPIEEVSFGYERFPADPEYTRLLLIMVRREVVTAHLARLRAWGITPTRVGLSTLAVARLLGADESSRDGALLLSQESGGEYLRVEAGVPVFSRGVAPGECPAEALRKSVELDVRRNGREAGTVALTLAADEARMPALAREADTLHLSARPVTALRPACLNGAGPLVHTDLAAVAAAVGVLAASDESNLLPEPDRWRLGVRRLIRELKVLALGLAWATLAATGLGHQAFEAERSRVVEARARIAALQQEAGDLVTQYEQLQQLSGERKRVALPLRVVLELYLRTFADIGIAQMVYDERGSLTLGGEAPSYTAVFAFLAELGKSPLFHEVKLVQSAKPRSGGQSLVEFKVQCGVVADSS